MDSHIFPFFETFSSVAKVEELINNEDLIKYIEPHRSIYKIIFSFLNNSDTTRIIKDARTTLKDIRGMMVKMYLPLFEELCNDIVQNTVQRHGSVG